jgi:hypothetical protein
MHDHDNRQAPREPLSIDATGGDWIKPPVRLGDDGALYVRDPNAVSGTRRIEPGTPEWDERIGEARAASGEPKGER